MLGDIAEIKKLMPDGWWLTNTTFLWSCSFRPIGKLVGVFYQLLFVYISFKIELLVYVGHGFSF